MWESNKLPWKSTRHWAWERGIGCHEETSAVGTLDIGQMQNYHEDAPVGSHFHGVNTKLAWKNTRWGHYHEERLAVMEKHRMLDYCQGAMKGPPRRTRVAQYKHINRVYKSLTISSYKYIFGICKWSYRGFFFPKIA